MFDLDQIFLGQFEDGDKGDDQLGHAAFHFEQLAELDELAALQTAQDVGHLFAHREFFAAHLVVCIELGARQQPQPGHGADLPP